MDGPSQLTVQHAPSTPHTHRLDDSKPGGDHRCRASRLSVGEPTHYCPTGKGSHSGNRDRRDSPASAGASASFDVAPSPAPTPERRHGQGNQLGRLGEWASPPLGEGVQRHHRQPSSARSRVHICSTATDSSPSRGHSRVVRSATVPVTTASYHCPCRFSDISREPLSAAGRREGSVTTLQPAIPPIDHDQLHRRFGGRPAPDHQEITIRKQVE